MSEKNKPGAAGKFVKNALTDIPSYLAHDREPVDNHRTFTDEESKRELYESRFFLKQRVWRNMRKMRRHPRIQYDHPEPALKILKPRHP